MSEPNEALGTNVPADRTAATPGASNPDPPATAPDVSRQIAALTEAVNQLLAAQGRNPAGAPGTPPAPDPAATAARERYVRDHLADLPEAYRRQMPNTADERQLAEAEQAIRRQFRGDLRATLGTGGVAGAASAATPDVGGEIRGGHGPAAAGVDSARLSPVQQIALGLRDAKPVGPAHPEVVHAPPPRDAARPRPIDGAPAGAD